METVLCHHEKPCLLKTGVNPGPNQGKSYYICSNPDRDPCKFVSKATSVPTLLCSRHPGVVVDLQTLAVSKTTGEYKHYFRCRVGRQNSLGWCGSMPASFGPDKENSKTTKGLRDDKQALQPAVKPLHDHNKMSRTPGDSVIKQRGTIPAKTLPSSGTRKVRDIDEEVANLSLRAQSLSVRDDAEHSSGSVQKSKNATEESGRSKSCSASVEAKTHVVKNTDASDDECFIVGETKSFDQRKVHTKYSQRPASEGSGRVHEPSAISNKVSQQQPQQKTYTDGKELSLAERVRAKSGDSVFKLTSVPVAASSKPVKSDASSQGDVGVVSQEEALQWDEYTCKSNFGIRIHSGKGVTLTYRRLSGSEVKVKDIRFKPESLSRVAQALENYRVHKDKLMQQLQAKKKLITSVKLESLPDKGRNLYAQVDSLKHNISSLNQLTYQAFKKMKENENDPQAASNEITTSHASSLESKGAEGISIPPTAKTAVSQKINTQGQPAMRQTKIIDHVMKVPADVLRQMYAANPQAMTLYGGRMTAARLKEVGSVTSDAIERLHRQLENCPAETEELSDPSGLKVSLMPHQKQALTWLTWREKQLPAGGILADDMGLGKTLTTISLILKQRETRLEDPVEKEKWLSKDDQMKRLNKHLVKSRATLVIAPASLIHQWNSEIEKRCDGDLLKVLIYHGPNRERDINKLIDHDIVLTTYNIVSKEVGIPEDLKKNKAMQEMPVSDEVDTSEDARKQPTILRIAWDRIILDEAHTIKNHKSLTAIAVSQLRSTSRWALTGTPIQNDLIDMYSLLRFLRCSPFDELKVWKRQVDNKSAQGTKRLNTLVKTLLLRRTKDQIGACGKPLVSLPDKNCISHTLQLLSEERRIYDKIFAQTRSTLVNYLKSHEGKPGYTAHQGAAQSNSYASQNTGFVPASSLSHGANPAGSGSPSGQENVKTSHILILLLRLRQCCSHLSLMKEAFKDEELKTDGVDLSLVDQMMELSVKEDTKIDIAAAPAKDVSAFDVEFESSKIRAVMSGLDDIRQKSEKGRPMKSVIISQWTKMLDIMAQHLTTAGYTYCVIEGSTPPKKRMELVEEFNTNPTGHQVMLVSLRAGGVGLNLIGGNHLFLLDMHWNPALEEQACDRVYRMGQKRDVFIHRFVCKNTVEEKILQLQDKKRTLAKNILSGAGASNTKLSLADLKLLFGL